MTAAIASSPEVSKPLRMSKEYLRPPGGMNPNVWMVIIAVSLIASSVCGYWLWGWYDWVCFCENVLALHLAGTVIHDASHRAAHSNRAVNTILGHASALMLGFAFPVFTRVHLQHHAHVNDPENDPDHFVSTGGPLWMIAARFFYHEFFFFRRRLWKNYELWEWFFSRAFLATIVYLGIQFDFIGYVMNFWFVPALVVGMALGLFFDYLPHRPFEERNRWKNARVYPGKILNILIFGQNYHLVHHLWPSIPWYKYQPAYYHIKPLLDQKESPQSLGIFQGKDFWGFLYDIFVGIRFHHKSEAKN